MEEVYEKNIWVNIFNDNVNFIIKYVVELDTNIVSYLKSFYDVKLKDSEIMKAVNDLRKDLDTKDKLLI